MQYRICGSSAVEICSWTKKHLINEGSCYKRKFYGIDTNRCMEMGPDILCCNHNCIYCWRPMEFMSSKESEAMDPQEMILGLIEGRKNLLSGFGGHEKVDKEKFKDAYELFPNHWAISLAGEPLLYDKIDELISILKNNKETRSIFVVTNGQEPKKLKELNEKDLLPVQLYVSVNAPNEKLYKEIARPANSDGWKRLKETLNLLKNLNTRTVLRFTQIKGLNDSENLLEEYAELFEETQSNFIEIKAYMFLGFSRQRLKKENMPFHKNVQAFAEKLNELLPSYEIINEHSPSRIVLFRNKNFKGEQLIFFNDPKYESIDKIDKNWKIYSILKKYRKSRKILDKFKIDSWDLDYLTLKEHSEKVGFDLNSILKEINEFIHENYLINTK